MDQLTQYDCPIEREKRVNHILVPMQIAYEDKLLRVNIVDKGV